MKTLNTYFIPTTASYEYTYDYYTCIHATNHLEAYQKAKELPEIKYYDRIIAQNENSFIEYPCNLDIEDFIFHKSEFNDIISKTLLKINLKEYPSMAYFKVNWNNYTEQLSQIVDKENWSNITYPNNGILANYLVKTHDKLVSEKKIVIGQNYALFNTGLFTKYYEPIYAYQTGTDISFLTAYELSGIGIFDRPERANYFEKPELLLFDWHYPIDVHYPHILEDKENQKRIPRSVMESENIVNILDGAINKMKKKVSANYKLAIPQYFEGKIQLLLPLCLANDNVPDLALVVTKMDNCYRGHTCLTLDMAYNNARLIAKPESNWLSQ